MLVSALCGLSGPHRSLKLLTLKNDSEMSPEVPPQTGPSTLDQDVNMTETPVDYRLSEEPLRGDICKRGSNLPLQSAADLKSLSQQRVLEDSQMDLFESPRVTDNVPSAQLLPMSFLQKSSNGVSVQDKTEQVGDREAEKYSLQSDGVQSERQILIFEKEADLCTSLNVKWTDKSSVNKISDSKSTSISGSTQGSVSDLDGYNKSDHFNSNISPIAINESSVNKILESKTTTDTNGDDMDCRNESIHFSSTTAPIILNQEEKDLCKPPWVECLDESFVNKMFESKTTTMSGTTDANVRYVDVYNKNIHFNSIMSPVTLNGFSVNKVIDLNDATVHETTEGNANDIDSPIESIHFSNTMLPTCVALNGSSKYKIFESDTLIMPKATEGNVNDIDGSSQSIQFSRTMSPMTLNNDKLVPCKSHRVECSDAFSANNIFESKATVTCKITEGNANDIVDSSVSPTAYNPEEADHCKSYWIDCTDESSMNKIFESETTTKLKTTDRNVNDSNRFDEGIHFNSTVSSISSISCFHKTSSDNKAEVSTSHKSKYKESNIIRRSKITDSYDSDVDVGLCNESIHSVSTVSPVTSLNLKEADLSSSYKVTCTESNITSMSKTTDANVSNVDGCNENIHSVSTAAPVVLLNHKGAGLSAFHKTECTESIVTTMSETTGANVNDMNACIESIHSVSTISPTSCFHITSSSQPERFPPCQVDQMEYEKDSKNAKRLIERKNPETVISSPESSVSSRFFLGNGHNKYLDRYKQNFESSKIMSPTVTKDSLMGEKKLDICPSLKKQSETEEKAPTKEITAGHADLQQADNVNTRSRNISLNKVLHSNDDKQDLFNKHEDRQKGGERHLKEIGIKGAVAVSVASIPATSNSQVQPRKQSQKSNSQNTSSIEGGKSSSYSKQGDDKELQPYLRLVSLYDKMLEKLGGSKQIDGTKELKKFEEILYKLKKCLDAETNKICDSIDNKDLKGDGHLMKRMKLRLKQHKTKEEVLQMAAQKHEKLKNRVLLIQSTKEKSPKTLDKKSEFESVKDRRTGESNFIFHFQNTLGSTTNTPENTSHVTSDIAVNSLADSDAQKGEETNARQMCLELDVIDGVQIETSTSRQLFVEQGLTRDTTRAFRVDGKPNKNSEIGKKLLTHHSEQEKIITVDTDKEQHHEKDGENVSFLRFNNSFNMKRTEVIVDCPSQYLHTNTGPCHTLDLPTVGFSCANESVIHNIDGFQAQSNDITESTKNLLAIASKKVDNSLLENKPLDNVHISSVLDNTSLVSASKRMSVEECGHRIPGKIHRIQKNELACCGNVSVGDLCESNGGHLPVQSVPSNEFGSCHSPDGLYLKLPVGLQNANTGLIKQNGELLGQISHSKMNVSEKVLLTRPAGCLKSHKMNNLSLISPSLNSENQEISKQNPIFAASFVPSNITALKSRTNGSPGYLSSKTDKSGNEMNVMNNVCQTSNSICLLSQGNKSDGMVNHFSVNAVIPEEADRSCREAVELSQEVLIPDMRGNKNGCNGALDSSEAADIRVQNNCVCVGTQAVHSETLERSPRKITVSPPSALSHRFTVSKVPEKHRNDVITTEVEIANKIQAGVSKTQTRSAFEQCTTPVFNSNIQPFSPNSVSTASTSLFPESSKEIAKRMAQRMKNKQQIPEIDATKSPNRDVPILYKNVSHSDGYLHTARDVSSSERDIMSQFKNSPKRGFSDGSKISSFRRQVQNGESCSCDSTNCHLSEGDIQASTISKQKPIQYGEVKTGSSNPIHSVSPSHKTSLKEPSVQNKHCSLMTLNSKTRTDFNIISSLQTPSLSQACSARTNATMSQTPICKSSNSFGSQQNKRGRKRTRVTKIGKGKCGKEGLNQGTKLSNSGDTANRQFTSYFPSFQTAPSSSSVSGKRFLDGNNVCTNLHRECNTNNVGCTTDIAPHTTRIVHSQISGQTEGEISDVSTLIRNLRKIKLIEDGELNLSCSDFPDAFWTENFSDIRISKQLLYNVDVWE